MATVPEVRKIVTLLMTRPITEDIAIEVKSIDGYEHLEIEDRQWVGLNKDQEDMTTGEQHGWIESLIHYHLMDYAFKRRAGRVYPGDVSFILSGIPRDLENMLEPDVAFVAQENVTPTERFIFRAPDLAVEIISPSQSLVEMRRKMRKYMQFGTQQVWIVIPETQEIEIHSVDGQVTVYTVGDTITGGDLLPGFSLDVVTVFAS